MSLMRSSVPSSSAAWEFYDDLIDRRRVLRASATLVALIVILAIGVWHPAYVVDHFGGRTLIGVWLVLVLLSLALPRVTRSLLDAFRGAPALRVAAWGLWSRHWSQLGWIAWRDIAAVVVAHGTIGGEPFRELRIDLRRKGFAQLTWNDKAEQLAAWLIGFLYGVWWPPQTLSLINSRSLCGPWDDVMAALDPFLAARGVRKRAVEEND
jgi:hypothetical protein